MTGTRRLRYTGERPQAFMEHGIGHVETGAEFEVPEDQAERYLRRADIEEAGGGKAARKVKAEIEATTPPEE